MCGINQNIGYQLSSSRRKESILKMLKIVELIFSSAVKKTFNTKNVEQNFFAVIFIDFQFGFAKHLRLSRDVPMFYFPELKRNLLTGLILGCFLFRLDKTNMQG